jgi:hypothetical protein
MLGAMERESYAYPGELARAVRMRFREALLDAPPAQRRVVDGAELEQLLSVAYQASLLHEEGRAVVFRLLVADPEELDAAGGPPDGVHVLRFTAPVPLTPHELRRLAPAAKYARSLLGVRAVDDGMEIWGILHTGPRWMQVQHGGRGARSGLPEDALVVLCKGPAQLLVTHADEPLAEIRGGVLVENAVDVLESQWIGEYLQQFRAELLRLHAEQRARMGSVWGDVDPTITRLIGQQVVKRFIATMRDARHGGALLCVPEAISPSELEARWGLVPKHSFVDGEARRRYGSLMLAALAVLAAEASPRLSPIGWAAYDTSDNVELARLDEALLEYAHLVAGLADVDGAVVLTPSFEVLGFGAEIVGGGEVPIVERALDAEAVRTESESALGVGTRHRSAYRFVARTPGALAVVVSQDGSVRFVARREGRVIYWEHTPGRGR